MINIRRVNAKEFIPDAEKFILGSMSTISILIFIFLTIADRVLISNENFEIMENMSCEKIYNFVMNTTYLPTLRIQRRQEFWYMKNCIGGEE